MTPPVEKRRICYVATTGKCLRLFLLPQAKYLAEHGWQVTVAASEDAELRRNLLPDMRYVVLPLKRGVSPWQLLTGIWTLFWLFKRERYNFIQYFMPNAAFYASIAGWLLQIPHRYYQLGGLRYSASTGLKRKILLNFDKLACACSTQVIILSRGNLELAEQDGLFPPGKGKIIGHGGSRGVDLPRFDLNKKAEWRSTVRQELNIAENDIVIGFAGSIRRDKGVGELITAFKKLLDTGRKDLKLVLLGDLDYFNTIDKDIRNFADCCKEIIIVPGRNSSRSYLSYDEMPRYMSCWDMLGFPSYREGLPNVVIEAQALELPVVVADVPGANNALLPHQTGLLVPVQNVEKLYDALKTLVCNKDLRREYGHNGRKFVETCFNQKVLLEQILQEKEAAL